MYKKCEPKVTDIRDIRGHVGCFSGMNIHLKSPLYQFKYFNLSILQHIHSRYIYIIFYS